MAAASFNDIVSMEPVMDELASLLDTLSLGRLTVSCRYLRYILGQSELGCRHWTRNYTAEFGRAPVRSPGDWRLTPFALFSRKRLRRDCKAAPALYQLDASLATSALPAEPRSRLGSVGSGATGAELVQAAAVALEQQRPPQAAQRLGAMRFVALTPSRSLAVAADDAGHVGVWLPLLRRVHLPTSVHGNTFHAAYSAKFRREAKLKYTGRSGQHGSKLLFFKLEARKGAGADSLQVWDSGSSAAPEGSTGAAQQQQQQQQQQQPPPHSSSSARGQEEDSQGGSSLPPSETSSGSEDTGSISAYAWATHDLSQDSPGDSPVGGKPGRKGSKDSKAARPKGKELWSTKNLEVRNEREAKRRAKEEERALAAAEAAAALAGERKQRTSSMDVQAQAQAQAQAQSRPESPVAGGGVGGGSSGSSGSSGSGSSGSGSGSGGGGDAPPPSHLFERMLIDAAQSATATHTLFPGALSQPAPLVFTSTMQPPPAATDSPLGSLSPSPCPSPTPQRPQPQQEGSRTSPVDLVTSSAYGSSSSGRTSPPPPSPPQIPKTSSKSHKKGGRRGQAVEALAAAGSSGAAALRVAPVAAAAAATLAAPLHQHHKGLKWRKGSSEDASASSSADRDGAASTGSASPPSSPVNMPSTGASASATAPAPAATGKPGRGSSLISFTCQWLCPEPRLRRAAATPPHQQRSPPAALAEARPLGSGHCATMHTVCVFTDGTLGVTSPWPVSPHPGDVVLGPTPEGSAGSSSSSSSSSGGGGAAVAAAAAAAAAPSAPPPPLCFWSPCCSPPPALALAS